MIEYIGRYEDQRGTQRDLFLCKDPIKDQRQLSRKVYSTYLTNEGGSSDYNFRSLKHPLLLDEESYEEIIKPRFKKVGHHLHGIFLMMKMRIELEKE